jgi:hypothetical protein
MASRGSFQKRQKEAARKEKRQSKLDRRQGRAPIAPTLNGHSSTDDQTTDDQTEEHDSPESTQDDSNTSPVTPETAERVGADAK